MGKGTSPHGAVPSIQADWPCPSLSDPASPELSVAVSVLSPLVKNDEAVHRCQLLTHFK